MSDAEEQQRGSSDSPTCLSDLLPMWWDENSGERQRSSSSTVSLNMWGDCRPANYAKSVRRARLFRPARLALFVRVKSALEAAGVEYALYGGSALAVHREAGRMIPHDSDVDLVVRETDFARVVAIGNRLAAEPDAEVSFDASCSLSGQSWFEAACEIPYGGHGGKRVKFALTEVGWSAVGLGDTASGRRFPFDSSLVHLDVFTVSPHPLDPAGSLRVNWSVPGLYDSLGKRFPAQCLFPAAPCTFEGLPTFAPRDLLTYLTVEYGYLGRDAMYDAATGLYVKMPPEVRDQIPAAAARWVGSVDAK